MRALICLLAVCFAPPASAAEPKDLRGCWIERSETSTTTWRWKPEKHGVWRADTLTYFDAGGDPEPGRWRLKPSDGSSPYL
jgi:hypothetical protein